MNQHDTRLDTIEAIDLLVGTASAALPGGIVVGTAPGGVLGGSWASPTLDDLACTEAKLASEDFGAFTCGAGADDCLLDAGSVSLTASVTGTLPVANGGTGATSASAARTALGVSIGTDVQAFDADLSDLADGSLSGSKVGTGVDAGNITAGTLPVVRGGTGATTFTSNAVLKGGTTSPIVASGVLIDSSNNVTVPGTLTVGGQSLGLMTLSTNTTTPGTTLGTSGDINVETDATANNVCINTSATTGTAWLCGDFN